MASDDTEGDQPLSPDDAFAVLGNGTRLRILRTLGEAGESLSFSELRDRVGMRDSGKFNYHLDKLVGHFVARTDAGYALRQAGRRVVQAVLSGAVTEDPVRERTPVDRSCHYCGGPVEVEYRQEQVGLYCTECGGTYGGSGGPFEPPVPAERDRLGYLDLPPAGVQGRTTGEMLSAAYAWTYHRVSVQADGVCPDCSAALERTVRVCEDHDAAGVCDRCERRYAVGVHYRCRNCILDKEMTPLNHLVNDPDLGRFLLDHGVNVLAPSQERYLDVLGDYDEEVVSTAPLEARYAFAAGDDELVLTVDGAMNVVDARRDDGDP